MLALSNGTTQHFLHSLHFISTVAHYKLLLEIRLREGAWHRPIQSFQKVSHGMLCLSGTEIFDVPDSCRHAVVLQA